MHTIHLQTGSTIYDHLLLLRLKIEPKGNNFSYRGSTSPPVVNNNVFDSRFCLHKFLLLSALGYNVCTFDHSVTDGDNQNHLENSVAASE